MLVFKPCQNFLLLPPKLFTTTTNSKPHLLHHHHHHDVKLHFSPLNAHFKSTSLSSLPPAADSSSLTTTTTTADFLMDSGGLSYVEAIQVIQQVPTVLNKGSRKPRSVIAYFESIGFTKTHISKAISKLPILLVADVEKTLKPKMQMFQEFGISGTDLPELIASKPALLRRSLQNLIKALDFIKNFVKTDEDLIKIVKRKNNGILLRSTYDRESIEANLDVLRHHGVPESEILNMILTRLPALLLTPERFERIVQTIVSLGFKPETRKFLTGVVVMSGMKKATWDSKIDLLKGLGWSDEQILDAFKRFPGYLKLSGKKMKEGIEFFKESSLNWDASVLSQYPFILYYSLKARVIPRYAVFKCLMSNEIIKDDKLFTHLLKLTETQFLSTCVFKYQEQLPDLYEVYKKECMLGCVEDNGEITNQQDHGDDMTV